MYKKEGGFCFFLFNPRPIECPIKVADDDISEPMELDILDYFEPMEMDEDDGSEPMEEDEVMEELIEA
jgi:hypothetical protein